MYGNHEQWSEIVKNEGTNRLGDWWLTHTHSEKKNTQTTWLRIRGNGQKGDV